MRYPIYRYTSLHSSYYSIKCDGKKARFDTLGKLDSAHHAGRPTLHGGWVLLLRWVSAGGGCGRHPPQKEDCSLLLRWVGGGRNGTLWAAEK